MWLSTLLGTEHWLPWTLPSLSVSQGQSAAKLGVFRTLRDSFSVSVMMDQKLSCLPKNAVCEAYALNVLGVSAHSWSNPF